MPPGRGGGREGLGTPWGVPLPLSPWGWLTPPAPPPPPPGGLRPSPRPPPHPPIHTSCVYGGARGGGRGGGCNPELQTLFVILGNLWRKNLLEKEGVFLVVPPAEPRSEGRGKLLFLTSLFERGKE